MQNIYEEVSRIVEEIHKTYAQEDISSLMLESMQIVHQVILVQQELLTIYEETLPQALVFLLPKDFTGLNAEQVKIIVALSDCMLQKRPLLWERLHDLLNQTLTKQNEMAYLQSLQNEKGE